MDRALVFYVEPDQSVGERADTEYFVDPYSGRVLGSRRWGDPFQGAKTLMTFIYRLHYSLALGSVGIYLFGIVALLWTLDCFVGAYLTFPPARRRQASSPSKSWFVRWKPAWLLRTKKLLSLVFTWHRASGLWLWAMLLVFAWSGVGLNLSEVYNPVMNAAFGMMLAASTGQLRTATSRAACDRFHKVHESGMRSFPRPSWFYHTAWLARQPTTIATAKWTLKPTKPSASHSNAHIPSRSEAAFHSKATIDASFALKGCCNTMTALVLHRNAGRRHPALQAHRGAKRLVQQTPVRVAWRIAARTPQVEPLKG